MILNYVGIAAFAASGATVGVRKGFDLFGIATLGVLTGVGGGVLRDVLLDIMPPHSIQHWPNITVASLVALAIATPLAKVVIQMNRSVLVLDAIGMGFFTASGAAIAVDAGASWFAAVVIGMLTAIAGGMLRDVLAGEVPMVMGPDDLYAIPAMLGAATYVAIDIFGQQWIAVAVGSALATLLRLAGLAFHWRLPTGPRDLITPDEESVGTISPARFVEGECRPLRPPCRHPTIRPSDSSNSAFTTSPACRPTDCGTSRTAPRERWSSFTPTWCPPQSLSRCCG